MLPVWNVRDETSGASQPAFNIYPYAAAQRVAGNVETQFVGIRVVSFNMGMPQSMLNSERRWPTEHVFNFRDLLTKLGHAASSDLVLCSEVGDMRQGFSVSKVDYGHIIQDALPGAFYVTSGAYLNVWNIQNRAAAVVDSDTWSASAAHTTDMHWQAFDLTFRDAPQLADRAASQLAAPKVGLLVGNMHITAGKHKASIPAKRKILQQALQHLTSLEVDAWRFRKDFHIMRLLVGDCKLTKEGAKAATQKVHLPSLTALQRDFNFGRWEVCDVDFPRQVLESARRQKLSKPRPKAWPRPKACCLRADPKASLGSRQHKARCSPRPRSCPNT